MLKTWLQKRFFRPWEHPRLIYFNCRVWEKLHATFCSQIFQEHDFCLWELLHNLLKRFLSNWANVPCLQLKVTVKHININECGSMEHRKYCCWYNHRVTVVQLRREYKFLRNYGQLNRAGIIMVSSREHKYVLD